MGLMFTDCPIQDAITDNILMGVSVMDHWGWSTSSDENNVVTGTTQEKLHKLLSNKAWWLERSGPDLDFVPSNFQGLPELLNLQGGFFLEWSVCDLWGSSAAAGGRVRR